MNHHQQSRRGRLFALTAAVTALGLGGAGVQATTEPPEPAEGTSGDDAEFETEWADLIAAAQEEGELVTIGGPNVQDGEGEVFQAFADEFGIELTMDVGSTDEILARMLAERQQGIYSVDVNLAGPSATGRMLEAGVFTELMPQIIHPDALDRSTGWFLDDWPWHADDTEQQFCTHYALHSDVNFMPIYYNTDLVSEEQVAGIESWDDLLDPQWVGQFVIGNVAAGEAGSDRIIGWQTLGEEWFARFVTEMEPTVLQLDTSREMSDGLARGDWAFAMFADSDVPFEEAQELGLPVAPFPHSFSEGFPGNPYGSLCIFDQAAHPATAQLFVNWLLSQEGQQIYNDLLTRNDSTALRTDVTQGNVADDVWARAHDPGLTLLDDPEAARLADEESIAWWQEQFEALGIAP